MNCKHYYGTNLVTPPMTALLNLPGTAIYGYRAGEELMNKQHSDSLAPMASKPISSREIDYSPKNYTLSENLLAFGKMFIIAAIVVALLWIGYIIM